MGYMLFEPCLKVTADMRKDRGNGKGKGKEKKRKKNIKNKKKKNKKTKNKKGIYVGRSSSSSMAASGIWEVKVVR